MTASSLSRTQFLQQVPNPPKIMIGCLTYSKRKFVVRELLESFANQLYPNFIVVMVDTSRTSGKEFPELAQIAGEVFPDTVLLQTTCTSINSHVVVAEGREQLRQYFLESDAEYFFVSDDDTILPPDALAKLFLHRREAAVGVYVVQSAINGGKKYSASCWTKSSDGTFAPIEIGQVLANRVIEADSSGLGCALLHRTIAQKVPFTYRSPYTEDFCFFMDAAQFGVRPLVDTSVKCKHHRYPPGDGRNIPLQFAHYEG